MRVVGVTLTGELKEVVLQDCPTIVDLDRVALLGRKHSDIFKLNTVVMHDEVHDVMEGDEVYEDDELIGIAYYTVGWRVHKLNGEDKELRLSDHISMRKSKRDEESLSKVTQLENREQIKLVVNKTIKKLTDCLLCDDTKASINGMPKKVLRKNLHLYAGFSTNENNPVYFGMFIAGGFVEIAEDLSLITKFGNKIKRCMED